MDCTHSFDVHAPTLVKLPEYLRRNGFRNPESATAAPFQYAFDTPLHHFEWLKHNPRQLEAFNRLMTAQRQGVDWFEYYPVEDRLVRPWRAEADSVFLVDIGGGIGHDLIKFHERYPDIHGKLILQDLPSSIESIRDMPSAISPMAHDFFTPNPVRGARVYYMRSILHVGAGSRPSSKLRSLTHMAGLARPRSPKDSREHPVRHD